MHGASIIVQSKCCLLFDSPTTSTIINGPVACQTVVCRSNDFVLADLFKTFNVIVMTVIKLLQCLPSTIVQRIQQEGSFLFFFLAREHARTQVCGCTVLLKCEIIRMSCTNLLFVSFLVIWTLYLSSVLNKYRLAWHGLNALSLRVQRFVAASWVVSSRTKCPTPE